MQRGVLLVAVASSAVAGCGGGDASTAVATSLPAAAPTAVVPVPEPANAPATASPTAPAAAPATGVPAGDATADCMDGRWVADAAEHQRRTDEMAIPLAMTVGPDAVSNLTIADGTFVADSVISMGTDIGGVTLSSSGTSHMEGTFTLDDAIVHADVTVLETTQGDFVATGPDGSPISMPAVGFEPPPADPSFEGSTVTCDATALTFDVIGSEFGTITYARVG